MTANKRDLAPVPDHIMLLLGQLLEAAKAAGDGLRVTSTEGRITAAALTTLTASVANSERRIEDTRQTAIDMKSSIEKLHQAVDNLKASAARKAGASEVFWRVVNGLGWLVATAISVVSIIRKAS